MQVTFIFRRFYSTFAGSEVVFEPRPPVRPTRGHLFNGETSGGQKSLKFIDETSHSELSSPTVGHLDLNGLTRRASPKTTG